MPAAFGWAGKGRPGIGSPYLTGFVVHGFADDVQDAAEAGIAHGHRDRRSRVLHLHAAHETVRGVHGDRANRAFAEVLGDLEHQVVLVRAERGIGHAKRAEQLGQLSGRKLDVDDGADDLGDGTAY